MGERYWITGVQLGMLIAEVQERRLGMLDDTAINLLSSIRESQLIGNIPEPRKDYEIVIKKKR